MLEESLNGGYAGLYGEVVTADVYHIRDVADIVSINDPNYVHEKGHPQGFNFIPDVVLDLGANVGIFSRYARTQFPSALIVSVEPNQSNCSVFKQFTSDDRIILIEKGIGKNNLYRVPNALNGAMEVYLSEGAGFAEKELSGYGKTSIGSVMLMDLKRYIKDGDRVLLKLDIEGNETVIFSDADSMAMLKTFGYIAIELHYYAATFEKNTKVKEITDAALAELSETHNTRYDGIYFYATKK